MINKIFLFLFIVGCRQPLKPVVFCSFENDKNVFNTVNLLEYNLKVYDSSTYRIFCYNILNKTGSDSSKEQKSWIHFIVSRFDDKNSSLILDGNKWIYITDSTKKITLNNKSYVIYRSVLDDKEKSYSYTLFWEMNNGVLLIKSNNNENYFQLVKDNLDLSFDSLIPVIQKEIIFDTAFYNLSFTDSLPIILND